ncbi:uncharacterized protein LOC135335895 isoform X2 [Halichondria panicea]|uniref:uncharacterized protein LOC135335895 isoform X2 n=1 Tax=Halichondria panicea TaxID=6063 RepID=UPI00312B948A
MASPGVTRADSNDCTEGTHMKSRPLLKDLMKDLDTLIAWQLLMIKLGVEKFENDKIEINFQGDIDRQKQEAFDKWLRKKPGACWKDVIDALYEMKEITLASSLARKYAWEDPRVYVSSNFLSTSKPAHVTARKIGDIPCRRFLPKLDLGLDYYTLEDALVRPINIRSATVRTTYFSGLLLRPEFRSDCYNLADFFRSIERNNSKSDFKVGLEARFGHLYLKLNPENVLPANSTSQEWIRSKSLRKAAFNTQVEEADVGQLFVGREQLGKEVTEISVKFKVEGQHEGRYSAVIATYEDGDVFYLDAVYREPAIENRARLSIALPGYKYDLRISDCTECILLAEHENSIPYQMAETITNSMCRLPARKLRIILHGSSRNKESVWKVNYIRQCIQKQYKWKPERKWILAQYDVDVFDYKTNRTVEVHPLNEGVDITEVDYSRKEIELWGQKIYPRNVDDTHPSRDKYYYMEGIEGVRLPGEELREPYNWTTEELLRNFDEFLGDAFKIAHILDGSPY